MTHPIDGLELVRAGDLEDELHFLDEARKAFRSNQRINSFHLPGNESMLAIRWGSSDQAVMILRLDEDTPARVYCDELPERSHWWMATDDLGQGLATTAGADPKESAALRGLYPDANIFLVSGDRPRGPAGHPRDVFLRIDRDGRITDRGALHRRFLWIVETGELYCNEELWEGMMAVVRRPKGRPFLVGTFPHAQAAHRIAAAFGGDFEANNLDKVHFVPGFAGPVEDDQLAEEPFELLHPSTETEVMAYRSKASWELSFTCKVCGASVHCGIPRPAKLVESPEPPSVKKLTCPQCATPYLVGRSKVGGRGGDVQP